MNDFLPLFADEARTQLEALTAALHQLEDVPGSADAVRAAFQAAHSIKGGAAMLDLRGPQLVTAALEDLLAHLRAGGAAPDGWLPAAFAARDCLLRHLDTLRPAQPPDPEDARVAQAIHDLLRAAPPPGPQMAAPGAQPVRRPSPGAAPDPATPDVTGADAAGADAVVPPPAEAAAAPHSRPDPLHLPRRSPVPSLLDAGPLTGDAVRRSAASPDRPAPVAAVFDVSDLSRAVLGAHLRRLGYQVITDAQVTPPGRATRAVVSATLIDAALQAGWPPGALWVVSEQPAALAAARARGLPASPRPSAQTPPHALPTHWIP